MSTFDDLVRRARDDPTFAAAVLADPATTLAGHDLGHDQLRQLDRLVRGFAPQPIDEGPGDAGRA